MQTAKKKQEKLNNNPVTGIPSKTIPPRNPVFTDARIFTERFVIMRGTDYYLRLFYDGSTDFEGVERYFHQFALAARRGK